jgi:hypothetical protein
MTNNEYLKAMHEGMPGAWACQLFSKDSRWIDCPRPKFLKCIDYRLIPVVPSGCEPPPEEACAYGPDRPGAVCIDGPVKLPDGVGCFSAWCIDHDDHDDLWEYDDSYKGTIDYSSLLNLADPNAAAILALNRPDWKMPETGPELPEGAPPLPDGWEYVGMGDAMPKHDECIWFRKGRDRWTGPEPCSQHGENHYARRKQPTQEQKAALAELTAEGQEREEYDPRPELLIPADVLEMMSVEMKGRIAFLANYRGYSIRWDNNGIVGWRDE